MAVDWPQFMNLSHRRSPGLSAVRGQFSVEYVCTDDWTVWLRVVSVRGRAHRVFLAQWPGRREQSLAAHKGHPTKTPSTGLRHSSLEEGAGKRCSECAVTHPFGDHSRAFGFWDRVLFLLRATDSPDSTIHALPMLNMCDCHEALRPESHWLNGSRGIDYELKPFNQSKLRRSKRRAQKVSKELRNICLCIELYYFSW